MKQINCTSINTDKAKRDQVSTKQKRVKRQLKLRLCFFEKIVFKSLSIG